MSLLRHPQDIEPLDAAECKERLHKIAFVGRVFRTPRLNMDRYLHFRRSLGGPQRTHELREMDRGHHQGVALVPVLQAWEHDCHFHDGKSDVVPEIISTGNRELMVLHLLCNSRFVEPHDGPNILELEDTPGLVINLSVSQKNSDLICHCVCPPGIASNGSDGYFTWLDRAITVSS